MILRIRYENEVRSIELDAEATEGLWVSLDLETDEEITQPEREKRIQDAFDEKFNRPEYNNYHKFTRHQGFSKAQPGKDETEDDVDTSEPLMKEVFDDRIFRRDEITMAAGRVFQRHAPAPLMLAAVLSSDFAHARQSLSAGGLKGSLKHSPCGYWPFADH